MYPVSDNFFKAIIQSGSLRKTVADIYYGNLISPVLTDLPIVSGEISIDRTSSNRRSGSFVIGDPELFPIFDGASSLEPYGSMIVVRSGFVYPDRSEELVPLGVFPIFTVSGSEADGLFSSVQVFDRSRLFEKVEPFVLRDFAGLFAKDRLTFIAQYVINGLPVTISPALTDVKLPGGTTLDQNEWENITHLAEALAGEVFFDVTGGLIVQKPPVITTDTTSLNAVWTISAGESGVMIDAARTITRDDTYNGIGVYGAVPSEGQTRPYGQALDSNSVSKTFYYGPFGKQTRRIENELLTSSTQCTQAAEAILSNSLGLARNLSLESLYNPALDAGDIILVKYPDLTEEVHLVDSIQISLGTGRMTVKTRTKQYVV